MLDGKAWRVRISQARAAAAAAAAAVSSQSDRIIQRRRLRRFSFKLRVLVVVLANVQDFELQSASSRNREIRSALWIFMHLSVLFFFLVFRVIIIFRQLFKLLNVGFLSFRRFFFHFPSLCIELAVLEPWPLEVGNLRHMVNSSEGTTASARGQQALIPYSYLKGVFSVSRGHCIGCTNETLGCKLVIPPPMTPTALQSDRWLFL